MTTAIPRSPRGGSANPTSTNNATGGPSPTLGTAVPDPITEQHQQSEMTKRLVSSLLQQHQQEHERALHALTAELEHCLKDVSYFKTKLAQVLNEHQLLENQFLSGKNEVAQLHESLRQKNDTIQEQQAYISKLERQLQLDKEEIDHARRVAGTALDETTWNRQLLQRQLHEGLHGGGGGGGGGEKRGSNTGLVNAPFVSPRADNTPTTDAQSIIHNNTTTITSTTMMTSPGANNAGGGGGGGSAGGMGVTSPTSISELRARYLHDTCLHQEKMVNRFGITGGSGGEESLPGDEEGNNTTNAVGGVKDIIKTPMSLSQLRDEILKQQQQLQQQDHAPQDGIAGSPQPLRSPRGGTGGPRAVEEHRLFSPPGAGAMVTTTSPRRHHHGGGGGGPEGSSFRRLSPRRATQFPYYDYPHQQNNNDNSSSNQQYQQDTNSAIVPIGSPFRSPRHQQHQHQEDGGNGEGGVEFVPAAPSASHSLYITSSIEGHIATATEEGKKFGQPSVCLYEEVKVKGAIGFSFEARVKSFSVEDVAFGMVALPPEGKALAPTANKGTGGGTQAAAQSPLVNPPVKLRCSFRNQGAIFVLQASFSNVVLQAQSPASHSSQYPSREYRMATPPRLLQKIKTSPNMMMMKSALALSGMGQQYPVSPQEILLQLRWAPGTTNTSTGTGNGGGGGGSRSVKIWIDGEELTPLNADDDARSIHNYLLTTGGGGEQQQQRGGVVLDEEFRQYVLAPFVELPCAMDECLLMWGST